MPHQTSQTARVASQLMCGQVIELSFACISRRQHKELTRRYAFQHKVCFETKNEKLILDFEGLEIEDLLW